MPTKLLGPKKEMEEKIKQIHGIPWVKAMARNRITGFVGFVHRPEF